MGARWQSPSGPDPGALRSEAVSTTLSGGMKAAVPRPRITQRLQAGVGWLHPTPTLASLRPGSGTRGSCVLGLWHGS